MRYIIAFILIINSPINVFTQNYFNNLYNYNELQEFDREVHLFNNNNNLVVLGAASYEGPLTGIIIRYLNNNGDLLWEDFIKDDTLGYKLGPTHSSYIFKANLYIMGAAEKWSTTELEYYLPFFIKYDILRKEVVQKKYFHIPHSSGIRSMTLKDNFIYGVGNIKLTEEYRDSDGLIMKLNLDGNLIWQKTTDYGIGDYLWEVEALNGHLIVPGVQVITEFDHEAIILKIDTGGNFVKKIEPEIMGGGSDSNIEVHNNSVYYSVSSADKVIQFRTEYLAKYDKDLELQWDTLIPNTSQYYILGRRMEVLNNQIIIAGNIKGAREFTNNNVWSYAISWSLDGKFNWEHVYRYDEEFAHHIDDIETLPNGDLVFMGTVFDRVNITDNLTDQYLWLFRTDSLGCGTLQLTCYYTLDDYFSADTMVSIIEPQFQNSTLVEILGNPFTNNLQLKALINKPLQLQFYNTSGQLLATENINNQLNLNTQNWSLGIYFMQVFDNSKLLGVEKVVKQ